MNLKPALAMASIAIFISACAGRPANPVMVHQYGDRAKSCSVLEMEMSQVEGEIARLIPDTDKTGKNVALGVTGAFLLVPLFFMDFSHAEQIEVNALRQRYNHIAILAMEKDCATERKPIAIEKQKAGGTLEPTEQQ